MTLAPYATQASQTRGRLYAEKSCSTRSDFQRDRDRIIHSAAFRRLEYKTQVFINHEGDHYRTRLTHSLEVGQLTRSMCRYLQLDEDLGEALALAHDLGHTPFGHAGEDGLREVMQELGGFDHNAQALRILTSLEHRYAQFDGLNLTWETLEGIAKHNGPILGEVPFAIAQYIEKHDLEIKTFAGLEAQVAAIADDIAYNNHDVEDGIRAGFFGLDELADLPLVGEVLHAVDNAYPNLDARRRVHEVVRRIINLLVADVLTQTQQNIAEYNIKSVEDVRNVGKQLVHFSDNVVAYNRELKAFLKERMYRHYKVNRMTSKARRVVRELFTFFINEPDCLPTEWKEQAENAEKFAKARLVADFIAGMTDRFALQEHRRVFDVWDKEY